MQRSSQTQTETAWNSLSREPDKSIVQTITGTITHMHRIGCTVVLLYCTWTVWTLEQTTDSTVCSLQLGGGTGRYWRMPWCFWGHGPRQVCLAVAVRVLGLVSTSVQQDAVIASHGWEKQHRAWGNQWHQHYQQCFSYKTFVIWYDVT